MKTKFLLAVTLVFALSIGSAFAATAATSFNAKSSEQPHHWRHHHRHHHHHMMKH